MSGPGRRQQCACQIDYLGRLSRKINADQDPFEGLLFRREGVIDLRLVELADVAHLGRRTKHNEAE